MKAAAGVGAAALAVATLLLTTGCASGSKSGASVNGHLSVLTLVSANPIVDPALQSYADAVARRSHGSLRITFKLNYHPNDLQVEPHLIRAVQEGKAQLAWVGARALEDIGVESLRPLIAPFLIDSYPLEQRVLTSPLAGEMLAGMRGHGLVGLAVLPGPLRRVEGRRPLLRPVDFRGVSFGTTPVPLARATVRALGARPFPLSRQYVTQLPPTVGGLESHLSAIYGNAFYRKLPYVETNVSLWPRPLVIFANAKIYRSLSPGQKQALLLAGPDAVAPSIRTTQQSDGPAGDTNLCAAERVGFPLRLITATPGDLAALRRAVQPVYTMLERDPQERTVITRIERMKRSLGAPPDAGPPCTLTPIAAVRTSTPLDGTYRKQVTLQQAGAIDHIPVNQEDPANYGDFVWVFDRGRFAFTQKNPHACTWQYGSFVVAKGRATITFADGGGFGTQAFNKPGETFGGRWSFYRKVLTTGFSSPLTRTSKSPSRSALFESKHCRLPAQALR